MGNSFNPYRRRRPSLILNLWIYRYLVAAALVLGLLLWFVWINNAAVTVFFPFGLGQLNSTAGVVILLSALAGSVVTLLVVALLMALRKIRGATAARVAEE
ncbi:MAG TPA: hypothetical protein VF590_16500, partial [Isosphaeraceae bacterium]